MVNLPQSPEGKSPKGKLQHKTFLDISSFQKHFPVPDYNVPALPGGE